MFPPLELFILYSSMHLNCAFSFIQVYALRQRSAFCDMRCGKVIIGQRNYSHGADDAGYIPAAVKNKIKETVCERDQVTFWLAKQPT